jgi:hypothetical protein
MYIGYRTPGSRSEGRMELFYDFMVHFVSFHMIFFAGLAEGGELQEYIGYSMIACILLMMAVSFIDIGRGLARTFYLIGKKYSIRYKARKKAGQVVDAQEQPEDRSVNL